MTTITAAVAQIIAQRAPVIILDTCNFLDLFRRDTTRQQPRIPAEEIRIASELLGERNGDAASFSALSILAASLFPSPAIGKTKRLSETRMTRHAALKMIQRRALEAGVNTPVCYHSFRATGITNYLTNGGTLEKAQRMTCHESAKTTKLYDRREDELTLDEVERIAI